MTLSSPPRLDYRSGAPARVRRYALLMQVVLIVQLLLGMWVNLYVTPPKSHPGRNASEYFGGVFDVTRWALGHATLLLRLHVILALILVVGALGAIPVALRLAKRAALWWMLLGAFGIAAAGFNGASFLNYGHDFSSMLMAAGFAIAMLGYGGAMYVAV